MLFIVYNTTCVYLAYLCCSVRGGRTPVLIFSHGDLLGRDPAARTVGGDWGVRACGFSPSATNSPWEFGPCGLSYKCHAYVCVD